MDAERVKSYFSQNNYEIVKNQKDADIIFFIGCAVGDNVADMSIQMVKEFQKYDAELIVSGCLPNIEKEKLNSIFNGRIIGTKYFDKDPSWKLEVDDFVDCIINNLQINNGSSADALKAMELVEKIYKADEKWWNRKKKTNTEKLRVDDDNKRIKLVQV